MAQIMANTSDQVIRIKNFLGLNENPDGDTNLKIGEFAAMRNFRITHDYHLQLRPGMKTMLDLKAEWDKAPNPAVSAPRFCGCWEGLIGGKQHLVAAFGGKFYDIVEKFASVRAIGTETQDDTTFFGFGGKLYSLNGHEYMEWDGGAETEFKAVEPYVPTITTGADTDGSGTSLENVNRLTDKRRIKYVPWKYSGSSETGTYSVRYYYPEKPIKGVASVDGLPASYKYTADNEAGCAVITRKDGDKFTYLPALEIIFEADGDAGQEVLKMRFAELYNGTNDSRIFLYGDGSNKCIYSGIDLGKATPAANYFPDLYEAQVGDKNSPLTALIRHYGKLLAFKPEETWTLDYTQLTTATGVTIPGFTVTPVNRQIGNTPMGQAKILENNPLTIMDGSVFRWKATGNLAADHRNAERISSRIHYSLSELNEADIHTFNDIWNSEYWIYEGDRALILDYANDTWYRYTNVPFKGIVMIDGEVYGFADDGRILHFSRAYRNDDGVDIDAYAETGSMDFGRDWMLKYSPVLWVAIQPESGARLYVSVETNRRSDYPDKIVSSGFASFSHVDFRHFSFGTNRKPQVDRLKMKVKKAAFYKIIYKSKSSSATCTVLSTDVQARYTGKVK